MWVWFSFWSHKCFISDFSHFSQERAVHMHTTVARICLWFMWCVLVRTHMEGWVGFLSPVASCAVVGGFSTCHRFWFSSHVFVCFSSMTYQPWARGQPSFPVESWVSASTFTGWTPLTPSSSCAVMLQVFVGGVMWRICWLQRRCCCCCCCRRPEWRLTENRGQCLSGINRVQIEINSVLCCLAPHRS